MAIKILYYGAILFFAVMIFLLLKNPYKIEEYRADGTKIPNIELFDIKSYQIDNGGLRAILFAKNLSRYDGFDVLLDIDAMHKGDTGLIDILRSKRGIQKDGILTFSKDTHYERTDGLKLTGDEIKYDVKNKILSSDIPFVFTQKNSTTEGNSFVYQMKEGKISALSIHSTIITEKR
ncbi:MAG: LPS export ABC transporter periplasmic protein LptC [Sulfurospirillaceae bacterium]|nr:LPS export ABC transporter periplasmic protein LptC [Sulfurospirillaceae bacterium]